MQAYGTRCADGVRPKRQACPPTGPTMCRVRRTPCRSGGAALPCPGANSCSGARPCDAERGGLRRRGVRRGAGRPCVRLRLRGRDGGPAAPRPGAPQSPGAPLAGAIRWSVVVRHGVEVASARGIAQGCPRRLGGPTGRAGAARRDGGAVGGHGGGPGGRHQARPRVVGFDHEAGGPATAVADGPGTAGACADAGGYRATTNFMTRDTPSTSRRYR